MNTSQKNFMVPLAFVGMMFFAIGFAADSIGPRIVTYGFTDAWSTALAAPQMNEAKRNHTIDSVAAAWMNNPKAIAKMMNERAIVFL